MPYDGIRTKAVLSTQLDGELETARLALLAEGEEKIRLACEAVNKLLAEACALRDQQSFAALTQSAVLELDDLGARAEVEFHDLGLKLEKATRSFRAFRKRFGLADLPSQPNAIQSLAMLVALGILEGGSMGLLLVELGTAASFSSGLLTGATISATLILLNAFVGGYLCLRNAFYGSRSAEQTRSFVLRRKIARAGCAGTVACSAFILAATVILRGSDSADALAFSLQNWVGSLTNLNSLLLLFIGIAGSIIGWWKGATGFADFHPGYSEAQARVDDALDDAFFLRDELQGDVLELGEEAREAIEVARKKLLADWRTFADDAAAARSLKAEAEAAISALPQRFETACSEALDEYGAISDLSPFRGEAPGWRTRDSERLLAALPEAEDSAMALLEMIEKAARESHAKVVAAQEGAQQRIALACERATKKD